jgi:hypothetical protein
LKIHFAIGALFSAAAVLIPANASSVLFTATTTLPSNGTHTSGTSINLNDGAGYILAYGYDGVFSHTDPTSSVNVNSASSASLDVSSHGLGLNSNDSPYIGPTDAIVLDFANVNTTDMKGSSLGVESNVTFTLDITGTGSSDWVVYGLNNDTGKGSGAGGTVLDYGPMSPLGSFTVSTSNLYDAYLIGVTQDCSLTIENVAVQYSDPPTAKTPEPATFLMAGTALIVLGATMKKRRRKV